MSPHSYNKDKAGSLLSSRGRQELLRLYAGQGLLTRLYVRLRSLVYAAGEYERHMPERGMIIDAGCGVGLYTNWLSVLYPHAEFFGFDLDEKRIAVARSTVGERKNINFETLDAVRCELPRCRGILMVDFLHHVPRDQQLALLKRAYDALEKGGVLYLSEIDTRLNYRLIVSAVADVVLYPFSCNSQYRKPGEWQKELEVLGFKVGMEKLPHKLVSVVRFVCVKP